MNHCFTWAMESKIKPMQDFALLLKRHEENILTYFDMPISNGYCRRAEQ
jgi:transposase